MYYIVIGRGGRSVRVNYIRKVDYIVFLLLQLKQLGYSVDKVEFIVMGGIFMSLVDEYRDYFIRNLYDVLLGYISSGVDEVVK